MAAYNKDKSPITTTGKLADGAPDDEDDYGDATNNRTITARIKELQGGQTVTFTLKETTAQVTVEDNVEFEVHVARDDDDTFTDLTHRITGDNHIAKVKIIRAADGSGSMVALASAGASADEIGLSGSVKTCLMVSSSGLPRWGDGGRGSDSTQDSGWLDGTR